MASNLVVNLVSPNITLATTAAPNTMLANPNPGSIAINVNVSTYESFVTVSSAGTAVALPASPTYAFWVRNLGVSNIQIICTPQGGSAWISPLVVNPGGLEVYIQKGTPGIGGISAMTLTSDTGAGSAEVFLAG